MFFNNRRNRLSKYKEKEEDDPKSAGYELGFTIREKLNNQFQTAGNKLNSWQDIAGKKTTSAIVIMLWLISFCYFLYSFLSVII